MRIILTLIYFAWLGLAAMTYADPVDAEEPQTAPVLLAAQGDLAE